MSLLIQLAIYAALAAGAALAFHEFEQTHYVKPAMEDQRAKDQVEYAKVNAQLTAAQKQSTDALADVASCTAASATQSAQVKAWQAEATRRAADAAKARQEGAAASAAAKTAVARYQQIASAPPVKDQTCQQKLDATDKLLRDAARLRAAAKVAPK
jgi:hypothetical protein